MESPSCFQTKPQLTWSIIKNNPTRRGMLGERICSEIPSKQLFQDSVILWEDANKTKTDCSRKWLQEPLVQQWGHTLGQLSGKGSQKILSRCFCQQLRFFSRHWFWHCLPPIRKYFSWMTEAHQPHPPLFPETHCFAYQTCLCWNMKMFHTFKLEGKSGTPAPFRTAGAGT